MSDSTSGSRPGANASQLEFVDGSESLYFADFLFDPVRQELRKGDTAIALSPKALALLRHLLAHHGRVLSREALMQALWGDVVVTDDSLVQCVKDLRGALADRDQRLIKTLPRRGYMFDVPVVRGQPVRVAASRYLRYQWVWACIGLLFLIAAGVTWPWRSAAPVNIDQEILLRRSIAILSFNDKLGKAAGSTLGDDLADAIAAQMLRSAARVIGRAATIRQDPAAPQFEHIGREQGVRYVLGGRITRIAEGIRADAYLTEIASGAVYRIHEATFKNEDEASYSDFGRQVAVALQARYLEIEVVRARLPGHESDLADMIALAWRDLDRGNAVDVEQARRRFELAVRSDPNSVEASAGLALANLLYFCYLYSASPQAQLDATERIVKRALELSPTDPRNLLAWAEVLLVRGKTDEGFTVLRRLIELSPDDPNGRAHYASALVRQGRYEEAQRQLDMVGNVRLYPTRLNQWVMQTRAEAAFAQERDDEAYAILRSLAAQFPTHGRSYLMLAAIDALHGRMDAAASNMARYRQMLPTSNIGYVVLTYPSTDPGFLAQKERLVAGLRKAGLPEARK